MLYTQCVENTKQILYYEPVVMLLLLCCNDSKMPTFYSIWFVAL